jgi:hypothetical protein
MAGKNGGKRPGAGRLKATTGIPKASTISKAEARDAHRRVIEKFALRMIRFQVAAAIGIGHVYTRDQHGKFTGIENEAVAHQPNPWGSVYSRQAKVEGRCENTPASSAP